MARLTGEAPLDHSTGLGFGKPRKKASATKAKPVRIGLQGGLDALDASEYGTAERLLLDASSSAGERARALVALPRLYLETGRLEEAVKAADKAAALGREQQLEVAPYKARALDRLGKPEQGVTVCQQVEKEPAARRARIVEGELLLRLDRRADATDVLMTFVDDYNNHKVDPGDGEGLALVGRAVQLLRSSKRETNEQFNEAEHAGYKKPDLMLWRARLYLDAYDMGHAEEVLRDALTQAPELAEAHAMMAEVRLAQNMDFDAAHDELSKAASVDKTRPEIPFLEAGMALRDEDVKAADQRLDDGLALDPKNLELLSMRATVRFLADDRPGFDALVKQVLALNSDYARLYQVVADYADWEHRYSEIVDMMNEAIKIDPSDGSSYVTLGLNQLRLGDEEHALKNLEEGFRKDKFNVRAYNTLNLYDNIPKQYDTVKDGNFWIRYPKEEHAVLERYLPALLDTAWGSMVRRYSITPTSPVGIETYHDREQFSVRTSGLPNIGIQGVCFGRTLAAMSPNSEPFNWGNVIWHELGHVFAIQLSKSHVPRWFTEGLSELETLRQRPEWQRNEDIPLYLALKHGKIPPIGDFNRVFTHASDVQEVTMAYFAASQILVFLDERYKWDKIPLMLRAWGKGQRTSEVIQSVLGVSTTTLDDQFKSWLLQGPLARLSRQYVPDLSAPDPDKAAAHAKEAPQDPRAQVELALAALGEGDEETTRSALAAAAKLDPTNPDVRFIRAKLAGGAGDMVGAKEQLEAMTREGHDGASVRILLGDIALAAKDTPGAFAQFDAAHQLDPRDPEPLEAIADLAKKSNDGTRELQALQQLAPLDQHDRRVWRRLLAALVDRARWDEAVQVGESAMFVDLYSGVTHSMYARALLEKKRPKDAIREAESALLCPKLTAEVAADANVILARAYLALGDTTKARAARDEALRQDPSNADAPKLALP